MATNASEAAAAAAETESWSLQVRLGLGTRTEPAVLMERLAGRAAAARLEKWLAEGGTLHHLATRGAPAEWPARLRHRIDAAVELVRQGDRQTPIPDHFDCPRTAVDWVERRYLPLHNEVFGLILLNRQFEILNHHVISRGNSWETMLPIADIVRLAIRDIAAGIVTWHNHPSGHAVPSPDDQAVWDRLETLAEACGLEVVDHLIVTRPGGPWRSARESGDSLRATDWQPTPSRGRTWRRASDRS